MATAKKRPTAKKTASRVAKKGLISKPKLSRGQLLAVVAMVVILGAAIIFFVRAATMKNAEPETWTAFGGTVAVKADTTAADGNYVEFMAPAVSTTPTTSPGDPTPTDTAPAADVAWRPDADNPNTGVKDSTKLQSCAGGDITQGGTASNPRVIENCEFQAAVRVKAPYVTIKNSRVQGKGNFLLYVDDVGTSADYFVGENLDLIGNGTQEACFVTWAKKATLRNSELTNCIDIIKHAGGTFKYNWIHDPVYQPPECAGCDGSHTDLMQVQGGMIEDMVVIGNNFEMAEGSALMEMGGETTWDSAPCVMSVTLQNNWLDANNYYWNNGVRQGTTTTYKCYPTASWQFIGNRFYRQTTSYGITGRYEVQRNNVWQDAGQTRLNNQLLNVAANQAVNF